MSKSKTIKRLLLVTFSLFSLTFLAGIFLPMTAHGATPSLKQCEESEQTVLLQGCEKYDKYKNIDGINREYRCNTGPNPTSEQLDKCVNDNPVIKTVNKIVNFLTAGVGIIVIIMVIIAGIQYSASQDNPQSALKAKKRVSNALLALLAYLLMGAFIQWIVPGGIF